MVRKQVTHAAVETIQRMILGGEFQPGQKMPSQTEMATRLKVSRASLREALSTLETLGFLTIEPGRGTFVSSTNPSQTGSLSDWRYGRSYDEAAVFQTRLFLESAIVAQAALKIDVSALDELRQATSGMREAWRAQDLLRVTECDVHFHETIVNSCGNAMLNDLYASVKEILQETQRHPIPVTRMQRAEESIGEHKAIIKALHERDRVQAASLMQTHVAKTAAALGIKLDFLPGIR